MLPNPPFVQRGELLRIPYKGFIKKHGFERRKILKINSIILSNFYDNSSNVNSTNKAITNEPQSPLSNLFILDKTTENEKIIMRDYLIGYSSCIDGVGDESMEIPKS